MNKINPLLILVASIVPMTIQAFPVSVFVVHCEPTNATPMMFLKLEEMVHLADQENVPMTILMTPQWANMVTGDATMQEKVEDWAASGHEIGCHHHPYWITKTRPVSWDGYTNTPYEELDAADQPLYLGDMDSFWEPFSHLSADINTGCMGGEEEDKKDWFEQLIYSTQGNAVDDAVTVPTIAEFEELEAWQIGHCFLYGSDSALLRPLYLATSDDSLFGVNCHVYNYDEADTPVRHWFDFLRSYDDRGDYRKTVSDAISDYLAVGEKVARDEVGLLVVQFSAISYTLPASCHVRLTVYDVSGRQAAIVVDEVQECGDHSVRAEGLNTGVYFCRLQACGKVRTARIVLVE